MKIAFLVIDVQEKYVSRDSFKSTFDSAKEYINYVSELFREAKQPVVHIRHMEPNEDVFKPEFQVSKDILQKENDLYVNKAYGNAFWKTDLEKILKDLEVDCVICSGLSAIHCVLATYNGAVERGFETAMLQNGLVGNGYDEVKQVYLNRNVVSYNIISYLLKKI